VNGQDVSAAALAARIERVRQNVADAAISAGRLPDEITIVAVSKTVERPVVDAAARLGMRHFGENRVQDAAQKFAEPLPEACRLHLIGHLQSNKAKRAVALFDMIESVDRLSLIAAIETEAERQGKRMPVLLQINVAGEVQKSGCIPDEAAGLMRRMVESPWLDPQGLMTMAPLVADPEDTRPVFAGLRILRDSLQQELRDVPLNTLSMGMSNDYAVAISEGATSVRIGRAIFGE
jgi:pyridoxal phosphate enzyme (YggS family)